jgi:hypothetical protein
MKIVIQTQHRENYAAHEGFAGEYHWKNKGGNTYIVKGVTTDQAQDKDYWDRFIQAVSSADNYFEEVVISSDLHDEEALDTSFCEHWENPYYLRLEDDTIKAARSSKSDGLYRADIVMKREEFSLVKGDVREYAVSFLLTNGDTVDHNGLVIATS